MPKGRLGAEQIVTKLRQMEVLQAHGKSVSAACKEAGTTEQTYYRWRREYGGLNVAQAKRLKQLGAERKRVFCGINRRHTPEHKPSKAAKLPPPAVSNLQRRVGAAQSARPGSDPSAKAVAGIACL
jgi:putative transposase